MSPWMGMAHDAGARGEEQRQMAAMIEEEERRRQEETDRERRVAECESERFMFHAATGGHLDCVCGEHVSPEQHPSGDEAF